MSAAKFTREVENLGLNMATFSVAMTKILELKKKII